MGDESADGMEDSQLLEQCNLECECTSGRGRPLPFVEAHNEHPPHVIWRQRVRQLKINNARGAAPRRPTSVVIGARKLR